MDAGVEVSKRITICWYCIRKIYTINKLKKSTLTTPNTLGDQEKENYPVCEDSKSELLGPLVLKKWKTPIYDS